MYATGSKRDGRRSARCLPVTLVLLAAGLALTGSALAQTPIDPQTVAEVRAQYAEAARAAEGGTPTPQAIEYYGIAPLAPGVTVAEGPGGSRSAVDLYVGLQPSPPGNGYWTWGQFVYWALDDGKMGPSAVAVGGGHVTEYAFSFALHADFPPVTIQPFVIVAFYNAPPDPVLQASNPVVEPPTPVSLLGWLFDPITLTSAGEWAIRTGLIDLESAGVDFDLDETYYVEVFPVEWAGTGWLYDPDVHGVFTGPGTVTYGVNQNHMWSDKWVLDSSCAFAAGNGDGYYDHPAEMDACGDPIYRNQSGIILRGLECPHSNVLELSTDADDELCMGDTVTVTLSMSCIPGLVRGYQAFLSFDPNRLSFVSGSYTSDPFGLWIIYPIVADGGNIELGAGINDGGGQSPTSTTADLVTLTFEAVGTGSSEVVFDLSHDPPTRLSDQSGGEVLPTLVNSPAIVVDVTAPVITCPASINKNADAGGCTLSINPGWATAMDVCDPSPLIEYKRSDRVNWNDGLLDSYPLGLTTINWRATDAWGNFSECPQTITVTNKNELVVNIDLVDMGGSGTLTRCITFELFDCSDPANPDIVTQDVTFTNGSASNVLVLVACGDYDCITARDDLHTLRRTDADDFGTSGSGPVQYVADFTGGVTDDSLIGGNLNDDGWIDILDFGVLSWQWGTSYDSDGDLTPDGHTPCGMFTVHADIDGDGLVAGSADFTFIQTYFLCARDTNCCGLPGMLGDDDGPRTEISVAELYALGLGELAVADLNNDGCVDELDIAAFADGVRPNQPVEAEPADLNQLSQAADTGSLRPRQP